MSTPHGRQKVCAPLPEERRAARGAHNRRAAGTTIGAAWRSATRALQSARLDYGHGCNSAEEEAAWIVLHAAGLSAGAADDLDALLDTALSAQQAERAQSLVEQRIGTRRPLAYLLGEAWLVGQRFYVDERVIVPRSFIAELLDRGDLDVWLTASPRRILDMCTGSGCLAILAALAWPQAQVDAVDVSTDALAVAEINRSDYGLQQRLRLIASDLWASVPAQRDTGYDLVLCNPPYVPAASMGSLPPEYRHEPALALAGGADGMDLVRRFLQGLPAYLSPQGIAVLEVGNERAAFEAVFPRLPAVWLETELHAEAVCVLQVQDLRDVFAGPEQERPA